MKKAYILLVLIGYLLPNHLSAQGRKIIAVDLVYDTAAVMRMDKYVYYSIIATRANGRKPHTTGYLLNGWLGRRKVPIESKDLSVFQRERFKIDYLQAYKSGHEAKLRINVPKNLEAGKDFVIPIPFPQEINIQYDSTVFLQYGSELLVNIGIKMSTGEVLAISNPKIANWFKVECHGAKFVNNTIVIGKFITSEYVTLTISSRYDSNFVKSVSIPVYPRGNICFDYSASAGFQGKCGYEGGNGTASSPNGGDGQAGQWGMNGNSASTVVVDVERLSNHLSTIYEVKITRNGLIDTFLYEFKEGDRITVKNNGGNGGAGGTGGHGGAGFDGTENNNNPGYGGRGGNGGNGGDGGNGGIIELHVPQGDILLIDSFVFENKGGMGGQGGNAGGGGRGGYKLGSGLLGILFTGRAGSSGGFGHEGRFGQDGPPLRIFTYRYR